MPGTKFAEPLVLPKTIAQSPGGRIQFWLEVSTLTSSDEPGADTLVWNKAVLSDSGAPKSVADSGTIAMKRVAGPPPRCPPTAVIWYSSSVVKRAATQLLAETPKPAVSPVPPIVADSKIVTWANALLDTNAVHSAHDKTLPNFINFLTRTDRPSTHLRAPPTFGAVPKTLGVSSTTRPSPKGN